MKRIGSVVIGLTLMLAGCWPYIQTDTALDRVIETTHVTDIYQYLNEDEYTHNTLVMFDIDNTVLTPPTDLGSDQWFYAMMHRKQQEGMSEQEAVHAILPLYKQVLAHTAFKPVEKETVSVIKTLQKRGVTVIGLTARSLDLAQRTVEQLDEIGINLDKTDPHACPITYGTGKPALYIDGIIFTGTYSKGEVLAAWLKQIHYRPHKVIFIDDKLRNVESVEHALHKRGIPFIGLRYNFLDSRVKQFDWDCTHEELQQFMRTHPESRPIPAGAYGS